MPKSNEEILADLANKNNYHAPTEAQKQAYNAVSKGITDICETIVFYAPPSEERDDALRMIDVVKMLTNAAIARLPARQGNG